MHILFVHRMHPSQFGYAAIYLAKRYGHRCTFVSQATTVARAGAIEYQVKGKPHPQSHPGSQIFEDLIWHAHAVYDALKARPDVRPDLIVGSSGTTSTVFLRQLYDCPIINYFEFYTHPSGPTIDFRKDFPPLESDRLSSVTRNAMVLLDLETCTAGYSPTYWQRSQYPTAYRDKLDVIFDGVDTSLWRPYARGERRLRGRLFPPEVRLVTYAARGFESARGLKAIGRHPICRE